MSGNSEYRRGDNFVCPVCGKDSVVKILRKMDGWTFVGEFLVCALCEAVLQQIDKADLQCEAGSDAAVDALAGFFGTSVEKPAPLTTETTNFCRDCIHYYTNPFTSRCMLHERNVEPMQDCTDFSVRLSESTEGDGDPADE